MPNFNTTIIFFQQMQENEEKAQKDASTSKSLVKAPKILKFTSNELIVAGKVNYMTKTV